MANSQLGSWKSQISMYARIVFTDGIFGKEDFKNVPKLGVRSASKLVTNTKAENSKKPTSLFDDDSDSDLDIFK